MKFALDVLKLVDKLPRTSSGYSVSNQLARSGTSVGANYRAARTARSRAEFIAKLGIVVEEADESAFWLELASRSGMIDPHAVHPLQKEARELCAIFSKSLATARMNHQASRAQHGQMAK